MSTVQIGRSDINTLGVGASKVQIARSSIVSAASASKVQIARSSLASVGNTSKVQIARSSIRAVSVISVTPDQTVDYFDKVFLRGEGEGGLRYWEQIQGPPVTLVQGLEDTDVDTYVATFTAPIDIVDQYLEFEFHAEQFTARTVVTVRATDTYTWLPDGTRVPTYSYSF